MNLQPYDDRDGRRVWLDHPEVDLFLDHAEGTEEKLAFLLGVRSGLRGAEIVQVTPGDVVETSAGPRVRVRSGKGDKYRETPAPREVVSTSRTMADLRPDGAETPLVDRSTKWVRRHVKKRAQELAAVTDDGGWTYLTPHDLRRTWATLLAASEVDPLLVCDWGGWEDLETFLEHYRGSYSPAVQRRELGKVAWLESGDEDPGLGRSDPRGSILETRAQSGRSGDQS